MLEINTNVFISKADVIKANVYDKEGVVRVAFTMNTVNAQERVQFSGDLRSVEACRALIAKIKE